MRNENEYIQKCILAQKQLCEKNHYPRFAPNDGYCYDCRRPIYGEERGIKLEEAATTLITGCPFCRKSYCD